MNYLIGDIQGCCDALDQLLQVLDFSPSRDHLFALGDLVNRGPASAKTLRRLMSLEGSATCLLGNHDWHLLASFYGLRSPHRKDTLIDVLQANDCGVLLDWVRQQKLAVYAHGYLMVHAGVAPQWTLATTLAEAQKLEQLLQSQTLIDFLHVMYSNEPSLWSTELQGFDRYRFSLNALTRIRFVRQDGSLELSNKGNKEQANPECTPWFEFKERQTQNVAIAFGHWSTLGLLNQPQLLCIDSGCVWGGKLTAVRLSDQGREIIQIDCQESAKPTENTSVSLIKS